MTVSRQLIMKAMESLPEETTLEEAVDRIILLYKISEGLQQADAGNTVSNEEAKMRLNKWLK